MSAPPAEATASDALVRLRTGLLGLPAAPGVTSLGDRAQRLAGPRLQALVDAAARAARDGVPPGGVVGVTGDRPSLASAVGVLAALSAGVPFTAVAPDGPGPGHRWPGSHVRGVLRVPLDGTPPTVDAAPGAATDGPAADVTGAAYLLATSGSTGEPSVAVVTREGLRTVFRGLHAVLADVLPTGALWTHAHRPAFGFSVCELLGAATFGGDLVVLPAAAFSSGTWALRGTSGPTVVCVTPSELAVLWRADPGFADAATRTCLLLSGEGAHKAPLRELYDRLGERLTVVNTYAATETSGQVTADVVGPADVGRTVLGHVGRPLPGVGVAVVDGEVVVTGASVGGGYLDPARTAERFGTSPAGEPTFRTRDRGEITPDGALVVTGRVGDVVKVGARWVDLRAVERTAGASDLVRAAACTLTDLRPDDRVDGAADGLLVAVVPARPLDARDRVRLRRHVVAELPTRCTLRLELRDDLPRTGNGKLDTAALTSPEPGPAAGGGSAADAVRQAWADVVGVGVDPDRSLFDEGVDSLGVVALAAALTRRLGRTVAPEQVLRHPTLAAQVQHWQEAERSDARPRRTARATGTAARTRAALRQGARRSARPTTRGGS